MSTENVSTPEMAKSRKKHKKNKGATDNSTKKRKREEEQQPSHSPAADSHSPEQPAKKTKKKSKHQADPIAPTTTPNSNDLLKSHSPFVTQTTSLYLPLSPCAYNFPLEGLAAEHLSPLLLTYYPPLHGVLLAYSNARMSEHPESGAHATNSRDAKAVLTRSIDEYAVTYVWLTAEFLVFRPERGRWVEGFVGVQNESLLGLICYNYFNAVIERDKLPEGWRWLGDEDEQQGAVKSKKGGKDVGQGAGCFVDGEGNKVEGRIVFRVEDFEASAGADGGAGTVSIVGTLLEEGDKT